MLQDFKAPIECAANAPTPNEIAAAKADDSNDSDDDDPLTTAVLQKQIIHKSKMLHV